MEIGQEMDVFQFRDRLIRDYASYISSFIQIRDERIRQHVDHSLNDGLLWPEPLIQLNPSFELGDSIDELVNTGVLHPECRNIFCINKDKDPAGKPLRLHRHQSDAVHVARGGNNYILTTGTGSGKSPRTHSGARQLDHPGFRAFVSTRQSEDIAARPEGDAGQRNPRH